MRVFEFLGDRLTEEELYLEHGCLRLYDANIRRMKPGDEIELFPAQSANSAVLSCIEESDDFTDDTEHHLRTEGEA